MDLRAWLVFEGVINLWAMFCLKGALLGFWCLFLMSWLVFARISGGGVCAFTNMFCMTKIYDVGKRRHVIR